MRTGADRIRLGYWDPTCTETLWFPYDSHGFVCAPGGGGKGRDVLVPMLFTWRGSALVIDVKGQLASITARYRRDALGQEVYLLNPFNILPEYLGGFHHAQYDVTAGLDADSETFAADAGNVIEWAMVPDPHGADYWFNGASDIAVGVLMQSKKWWPEDTNLSTVYHTLCSPDLFAFARDAMPGGSRYSSSDDHQLIMDKLSCLTLPGAHENKETLGKVSTAQVQLKFIGNKPIGNSLSASGFDFRAMKRRPMTVYLILPGRYLASCVKWFRLIVGAAVDAFLHEGENDVRVLALLDEFAAAVQRLSVIEICAGLGRSYLQMVSVLQDLSQLKGLYPNTWETFLANSGFRMFFGPRDKTTADYISSMGGGYGVNGITKSLSLRPDDSVAVGLGYGEQTRRYLLPHECRELPGQEMLVFAEGIPGVIRAGRRPYYKSPEFAGCYDPDPYHVETKKHGRGQEQEERIFG